MDVPELEPITKISVSSFDSFKRGSVIPVINNKFLLGVDNRTGGIIDLGGHPEVFDDNIIDTALRELREESLGTFDFAPWEITGAAIFNQTTFTLVIPCNGNEQDIYEEFKSRITRYNRKFVEIIDLKFYTLSELLYLVTSPYSNLYPPTKELLNWFRVRKFLRTKII